MIRLYSIPYSSKGDNRTFRILDLSDQVGLGEVGDRPVHSATTAEASNLRDQRRGYDLMISASGFNLRHNSVSCQTTRCDQRAGEGHTAESTRKSSDVR